MPSYTPQYDFDFIVVGSGFGGSVSAPRLTEKGYRVAVMEMGRRWTAENLPRTNWSLRRWLGRPELGLRNAAAEAVGKNAQGNPAKRTQQHRNSNSDALLHRRQGHVLADDRHHRRHGTKHGKAQRERARAENQLEAGGGLVLHWGTPVIAIWCDYFEATADGPLPQILR